MKVYLVQDFLTKKKFAAKTFTKSLISKKPKGLVLLKKSLKINF